MSQTTTKKPRILLTGIDAESAGKNIAEGPDAKTLHIELEHSINEIKEDGHVDFDVVWLFLEDETPTDRLAKQLQEVEPYDGVMIGWGVRGIPQNSWLLEACIDVVRRNAPVTTKLMFSTTTLDHLNTIARSFPQIKSSA